MSSIKKSKLKVLSKYLLNQTWLTLELSTYEVKKSCASKVQWWDSHKIGIPIPKRNTKKEIEVMDYMQIQNLKPRG